MDHLGVLQEKIVSLRAEIAQIHEQNEQYRRQKGSGTLDQIAHGQRHERLQNIQKELGQLAALGRSVVSINQRREENRARLQMIKKSRASLGSRRASPHNSVVPPGLQSSFATYPRAEALGYSRSPFRGGFAGGHLKFIC
jgi:chromosome segregation ATPase